MKVAELEKALALLNEALPLIEKNGWEETFSATYSAKDWLQDNLEKEKQDEQVLAKVLREEKPV